MNMILLSVVLMPMVAAFVSYIVGRKSKQGRNIFVCVVSVIEFLLAVLLFVSYSGNGMAIEAQLPGICGFGLHFQIDGFRVLYGAIAAFMWMIDSLFSIEYFAHYKNRNRYYLFLLLTLGATMAVFYSADLYTTFVFFEIMSFASYVWVAQDEREESLRAALTYLAVAVIGGMVLLMGLFLLYNQTGTLKIDELYEACHGKNVYAACACMLVGFGAKAGVFPLHIWLPKAHPVAPAPASALLSGILTKTGVFGVLVISCKILLHDAYWGSLILGLGVITMFMGALLALFSIDLKRTLACSSVSQIGFIMTGIGMQGLLGEENALAVRGALLHMVNHSLFKLVLFLTAGVVYMNLHKLDLNEIRGFGRKKPLLAGIYLMGALGIGGIPGWNGYISKTLIHESIVEYIELLEENHVTALIFSEHMMHVIEWVFLISGGLTVAYMTKLFFAVFLEKNADDAVQKTYDSKTHYMNPVSTAALTVSALIFPLFGMFSHATMDKLADLGQNFMNGGEAEAETVVHYFTMGNLKGGLISIGIGFVIYFGIVRTMLMKNENGKKVYVNRWPQWLDLEDLIYRPVLLRALPTVFGDILCGILNNVEIVVRLFPIIFGDLICGVMNVIVDAFVVFMRKTVYRDSEVIYDFEEGNEITHVLGAFVNVIVGVLNKTIWMKKPNHRDYEHELALWYQNLKESGGLIGRSLSYGLILFCIGLCATLIYLLIYALR